MPANVLIALTLLGAFAAAWLPAVLGMAGRIVGAL